MIHCDTLCVIATCSDSKIISDQIEAVNWSCEHDVHIVIVDDLDGRFLNFNYDNVDVMKPRGTYKHARAVGFKVNEGLAWAVSRGIVFKMAMVLDDDALPIGKGLDDWAMSVFKGSPSAGYLGTKDSVDSMSRYNNSGKRDKGQKWLSERIELPEGWSPPTENIFYAVNFQTSDFVCGMMLNDLCKPEMDSWADILPCEVFQSWCCELLGFDQIFWGQYPNDLKPPLYSMHHGSVKPPDPRTLSSDYLVHHSVRHVDQVSESIIRDYYKRQRKGLKVFL